MVRRWRSAGWPRAPGASRPPASTRPGCSTRSAGASCCPIRWPPWPRGRSHQPHRTGDRRAAVAAPPPGRPGPTGGHLPVWPAGTGCCSGVGAGSTEADFAAVGADYGRRFATFAASLAALRALLAGDEVDGVRLGVWPSVLGGPRVLVGSWAGPLDRAGRAGARRLGGLGRPHHVDPAGGRAGPAAGVRGPGGRGAGRRRGRGRCRGGRSGPAPAGGGHQHRGRPGRRRRRPTGGDDAMDLRCPPAEAARRLARLAELGFDEAVWSCCPARRPRPWRRCGPSG